MRTGAGLKDDAQKAMNMIDVPNRRATGRFGRVLLTNDAGTHDLGINPFSRMVWVAAKAMTRRATLAKAA